MVLEGGGPWEEDHVMAHSLLKRGCCGDTPCCVGTRLKLRINDFKRVPTQHGVSPQHPRFNSVADLSQQHSVQPDELGRCVIYGVTISINL